MKTMLQFLRSVMSGKNSILLLTITAVNAGNYCLNLMLGRILGPQHFAEVGVLASAMLMVSFIAMGLQMTAAKYASGAGDLNNASGTIAFWLNRRAAVLGSIGVVLLALFIRPIQLFLNFSSPLPLLILAVGIPFYLMMSVGRGYDQGQERFDRLARSFVIEMLVRLLVTVTMVLILRINGWEAWYSEAVSLGFLASFAVTLRYNRLPSGQYPALPKVLRRDILLFLTLIGTYELTQILVNHSDVILIKHFFGSYEAGLYAALALIGRVVYFATWSVVMVLFPQVVRAENEGRPHRGLFYRAFALVAMTGTAITAACALFPHEIVQILFGQAYAQAATLLWMYAVATTLFATANVFAYYYMSLKCYLPIAFTGIIGVIQITSIYFFHNSLAQVVIVQVVLMAFLLATMLVYHLNKENYHAKAQNRFRLTVPAK